MIDFNDSITLSNMVDLFAREAQTLVRYQAFAKIAKLESCPEIATVFDRMAQNQYQLVGGHLDFLRTVCDPLTGLPLGSTNENLHAALLAETEEMDKVYPDVARTAMEEGFPSVASWSQTLASTKKNNVERLQKAIDVLRLTQTLG